MNGQHNEPHGGTWTVAAYSEEQCEVVTEGTVHVAFCNESPKGRANAHLISAAPELLKACRHALDTFGGVRPEQWAVASRHEYDLLFGAVAKAEGTK